MTMDGLIGHNFTQGNKFDLPELWRGVAAPSDFIAVVRFKNLWVTGEITL